MAMVECAKECINLRRCLQKLRLRTLVDVAVYCDSCGAIKLAEKPTFHSRSNHIDMRQRFICDVLKC